MKELIDAELRVLERRNELLVLYACEAGSRAWGFAAPDSDADPRFIYLRPPTAYLSVGPRTEVLEHKLSGRFDLVGWDLPRALALLRKSNVSILEWLVSPVVYRAHGDAVERLRELGERCFSPRSAMHHYLNMAEKSLHMYLGGERVKAKKYLHAIRPLLACSWIGRTGKIPPVDFHMLLETEATDGGISRTIRELAEEKRRGELPEQVRPIKALNGFIESELARLWEAAARAPRTDAPAEPLDELFRDALEDVWGVRLRPTA